MDVTRAGRGALTTSSSCRCGTELAPTAKFCSECPAPRTEATLRDRYRAMAISLGSEGHMAMAEAMR